MNNKPLISVIVPVYKVEVYLDKCISSIVQQTYTNLEIILVDDGSPDRSGDICDEWAKKDPRIRVIHKENGGGGSARNVALDISQGEWIGMVDSDDYIDPHMYEHLYSLIDSEVDIVECCIQEVLSNDELLDDGHEYEAVRHDVHDAMQLHIQNQLFLQTPPNKLYRRCTVDDIRFPSGTGIDDEYWTYRAIGNARKLVHSSCAMYAYRQQENSVMHTLNTRQRLRAVEAKAQRHTYIVNRFPTLAGESLKNLWFTCIYQGQVALRKDAPEGISSTMVYLKKILKAHPVVNVRSSVKERVWMTLAAVAFELTCRIRNFLKIGL